MSWQHRITCVKATWQEKSLRAVGRTIDPGARRLVSLAGLCYCKLAESHFSTGLALHGQVKTAYPLDRHIHLDMLI